MIYSVALHALAAVIWVGGMFFAYVLLRPSVSELTVPVRLQLWRRVLGRFFGWVLGCIAVLLLTGYHMIFAGFGGFGAVGLHVHIMQLTGWVMFLSFFHLYFAPWKRFRIAVDGGVFDEAAGHLNTIRTVVAINLLLGLLTVAIGASGRHWG